MGYRDVMALPMRTFWLMSSNISRLMAETDMRRLELHVNAAVGGDECLKFRDRLVVEMGDAVKKDAVHEAMNAQRDEAGVARLRAIAGVRRKKES